VSDNGSGIEETLLDRIFDPFFTTKPTSMGTGLGLYICHQHVESYEGAHDYLVEPFLREELVLRVERALEKKLIPESLS
jgi:signal transduction histidine kinase